MSEAQYFQEHPESPSSPVDVDVVLEDVAFTLTTDRGVFSRGALDAGTRLLLAEHHPLPAAGDVLDLGCGAGPIAIAMALRAPGTTVWAVDVNERARELTTLNARRAGASNLRVAAPSAVPPGVRFAAVWSNPPIRVGKAALHDLLTTWLSRLAPGGEALLVVQKHLGADSLAAWLGAQGFPTERIRSRAGYRLLRVRQAEQV